MYHVPRRSSKPVMELCMVECQLGSGCILPLMRLEMLTHSYSYRLTLAVAGAVMMTHLSRGSTMHLLVPVVATCPPSNATHLETGSLSHAGSAHFTT
ncbi:hypothetical protein R3I93_007103 [Phoxinus phoxinus]|uniref:Uncharacterized protein n=1 Tax=Phoxinus phoxinus TaxID=58324 RepID=A0AAN9D792_9TELE